MSKVIQLRNVPDGLHRELLRRARVNDNTLTGYIQRILEREIARPLPQEVFDRVARRKPVDLGEPAAQLIKKERADTR